MLARALLLALAGLPPAPQLGVTVEGEARATHVGSESSGSAVDVGVSPTVFATTGPGETTATAGYQGIFRLRQSGLVFAPYALHGLGGSVTHGRADDDVLLTGAASLVLGETTFDAASSTLEQPLGLTSTALVIPLLAADVTGAATHRPTRRLSFDAAARARAYATPPVDENGVPEGAEPLFGLSAPALLVRGNLVPQLRGGGDLGARYALTRSDDVGVQARVDAVTLLDRFGFASLALTPSYRGTFWRALAVVAEGGGFLVYAPDAPGAVAALPYVALSLTSTVLGVAGFRPELSSRVALEPYYDAFLTVLTERVAWSSAMSFPLSRTLSIVMSESLAVRVLELGDEKRFGRGDDVSLFGNVVAQYLVHPLVTVEAGFTASGRARAARPDRVFSTTPSAVVYVLARGTLGVPW